MVIVIVLSWALLGLAVFFIAMRGGPRGARQALHTESTASRRSVTLSVVVLFAFGLSVPAIVLAFNGDHKASAGVGGVHLNAQEQNGRELFSRSCAVCHTLAATKSVGQIGPNLDTRVGADISTAAGRKALVLSAITEGRGGGLGTRPAPLSPGPDARAAVPGQGSRRRRGVRGGRRRTLRRPMDFAGPPGGLANRRYR
jgi:cytochrome c5